MHDCGAVLPRTEQAPIIEPAPAGRAADPRGGSAGERRNVAIQTGTELPNARFRRDARIAPAAAVNGKRIDDGSGVTM